MSAAVSLPALAFASDHGDRRFRIRPALFVVRRSAWKTRPRCECAHCNRPRLLESDVVDEPRRALKPGVFGARKADEPSRYRESGEQIWRAALGEDAADNAAEQKPARRSRANFLPKPPAARICLPITRAEDERVLAHLRDRKVRPAIIDLAGGREDFVHEVWLELVNPPADLERPADLWTRVDRAVWRFEKSQRAQMPRMDDAANGPLDSEE